MPLIYRAVKGTPLTHTEVDNNFKEIEFYHTHEHTWTGPQRGAFTAVTSVSGEIALDLDDGNNFNHTMTEDTELVSPVNAVAGQSGVIHFTQHASAAKTLAFDAFWGFDISATPTITTVLSGTAIMSYIIDPGATSASCSWMNKS